LCLDAIIRLDVTIYESNLINEGLKLLLKHRYNDYPPHDPEHKDYIVNRRLDIEKLIKKIDMLQTGLGSK